MKSKRGKFKKIKQKIKKNIEQDINNKIEKISCEKEYSTEMEKESQKYQESLIIFRDLLLEYENKFIRLKEQNLILNSEKKALSDTVKEYEQIHKDWAAEKKNLVASQQRAILQAENCKQTMSFRLGHAIIFGFKSWSGFKNLLHTIITLRKEKKNKFIPSIENTLEKPQNKAITWDSQKPILQWNQQNNINYLSEFDCIKFNSEKGEVLLLDNSGVFTIWDCSSIKQMIVKVNVFSLDYPEEVKQALLTIVFYDESGKVVNPSVDIPFSKRLEKYYYYLNTQHHLDDYIFLLVPNSAVKVELGICLWDAKSNIYVNNQIEVSKLSNGISVILPTYKGEKTILKCLESLAKQTLPSSEFEVLVIINGEKDNTPILVEKFRQIFPHLRIRTYELEEGNVSKARNFAIQKASKGWITFIDDDDFVPPNYLNALYQYAMFNAISITGIEDIQGNQSSRSSIMNQLDKASTKASITYFDVTSTLTMNACKLAPSFMVKSIHYDFNLRSGEDVVYWCKVLNQFKPNITLISNYEEESYKRLIRENSISRKTESYDFNVYQRLEVIKQLVSVLEISQYKNMDLFIQSKINAQAGFIKRYLKKHPNEYGIFLKDIAKLDLHNIFINEVNSLFTDTLVISYCYAPYIDTSGVVMSKRIRAMGKPVDLITNSMNRVRETDRELLKISEYHLGIHHELNAPQSFANWNAISQFADSALDSTHNMLKNRKMYKNLYSRAMWPASHIAAALVKIKYPQMKWIAEFSDPILMDVSAQERYEELPVSWLEKHGFVPQDHTLSDKQNLFDWCEKLPYLYADELIFTNQNQLDYMLSYIDESLRETIRKKAVIQPQPTLDRSFYQLSQIKLEKEPDKFHLAYFGSFYVNRGFKPFIAAWCQLPEAEKKRLKLHIYTQQDAEAIISEVPNDLKAQIVIQKYVGYFDFLALSDQFDGLIVMDAETKGLKVNNPYLPSKISDYLGSNTSVLALIEEDSPMSSMESPKLLKANIFESESIQNCLLSLLNQ